MSGQYAPIRTVLTFWFQDSGPTMWFQGGADFDARVTERLGALYGRAAAGEFDAWCDTPEGCLALCILLDQAPRNMFRGSPRAFATDARALEIARAAVARGYDRGMAETQRIFLYLPFEHAEDMEAQRQAVRLFAANTAEPIYLDYAARHLAVIAMFGRFPHRNAILGRQSTAEETAFLAVPGSGF